MKKALFIVKRANNLLESGDLKVLQHFYKNIGYSIETLYFKELSLKIDTINFSEYDEIVLDYWFNSLFMANSNYAYCYEKIFKEAKENALSMFICDTFFIPQLFLWDKGEDPVIYKRNVYNSRPIKLIGSFQKECLEDKEFMNFIHKKFMRNLHKDSKFYPIEWVMGHIYFIDEKLKEIENSRIKSLYDTSLQINKFYYGAKKTRIKKSLLEMGYGSNENDYIFGKMNKLFPEINTLPEIPYMWIDYINHSKEVLIPYEIYKGDYQVTIRFLEAMKLYKDRVVLDNRLEKFKVFLEDESIWYIRAKEAECELREILN